jgi:organic radical activating enzyme
MPTYYSINVTNRCNKACAYCVNKDYVNKREYPDLMGFADLRGWLGNEIRENDIAEIAGTGEPTLCGWLPDLLGYLEQKKAYAILRTNGFGLGNWRKALGRALVILAKHNSSDDYIREKCQYLLHGDIVMEAIPKEAMQAGNEQASKVVKEFKGRGHGFDRSFFVTPDGKVRFMSCTNLDMGTVWDFKPEKWTCMMQEQCPFLINAWNYAECLKAPFLEKFLTEKQS